VTTIERRERNGRVTYSVRYRDPAGRSRREVFDKPTAAKRRMTEIQHAKDKNAYVDPKDGKVLFGEQAQRWYATVDAKPATLRAYRQLLGYAGVILDPATGTLDPVATADAKGLGMIPLNRLDTLQVKAWLKSLAAPREDGTVLSESRRRNALQVVSQVLKSAVDGGNVVKNVVTGIRRPKTQKREMLFLDATQVERLAETIDHRYCVLVQFAAFTGLRAGEIAALKVRHLDLLRGTVRVSESATEVEGRLVWGPTKTYESRTVPLPRKLIDALAAHLAERPHDLDALVFTAPEGGPLRQSVFRDRVFRPAVKRAGLPDVRFHDLRHTYASLMIREGASVKALQKAMGHATAAMTLDTYSHLYPDELENLAARLDQVWERAAKCVPTVPRTTAVGASSQVTALRSASAVG
jgi:integrase